MRQITKWLNSLSPEDFSESNTTSSVYYIVEGLRIRLADHFTLGNKGSDLQIICPINDPSIYIVVIKEGMQILGYKDLAKLKNFIYNYSLIFRIKKTSEEMKIEKVSNPIPEVDPVKEAIVNNKLRTSADMWGKLCEYISKDCPKWKTLTAAQKKACRNLLTTNKQYKDCVHLINVATNAKSFGTAGMVKFFEPYINAHIK